LQIEQKVHGNVQPQPNLTIYQENVNRAPILVVEVRPASAPHVIGDRWHIRGVGGVRALTQGEALQIFKNQRLAAWIDEFEGSDPLKRALAAIRGSIDDLRLQSFAGGFETHVSNSDDASAVLRASLRDIEEALGDVDTKVVNALDAIEDATQQARYAVENTSTESAESVWWSVMKARMMRLHTVHTYASLVGHERVQLVDDLVRDQLGEKAELAEYEENLAELAAYRSLRRAGEERRMEADAIADLISAVVWRRNGLPPTFGIDWLPDMATTPDLMANLRAPLASTNRVQGVATEVGLLKLPGIPRNRMVDVLRGGLSLNEHVLSTRIPEGVYRLAVPATGDIWAVVFVPGDEVDEDATTDLAHSVVAFSALIAESRGSSWCVEGPGRAIPTT